MELEHTESQRLRDSLSAALDLKESSSGKDPFVSHQLAAEHQEALAVDDLLTRALEDEEHPTHERLDKLISLRDSFKAARVEVAPEEQLWREEVDNAMK